MREEALEQQTEYCDRNICMVNEYNGIGCNECEVTKSKEPQESDTEKRKPCINYEDGCEEWAGCPCVYYKGRK